MVLHFCNPSYSRGEDQEDHVLRQAQLERSYLKKKLGMVTYASGPRYSGCEDRKIMVLSLAQEDI
jgi:hypothetical protein